MCETCGCSDAPHVAGHATASHHHHHATPDPHHDHATPHRDPRGGAHDASAVDDIATSRTITVDHDLLARAAQQADRNRRWLAERGIFAVNLVSSPGAGKTTLLERTLADRPGQRPFAVIAGDQSTDNDARRLRAAGAPVVQVNTDRGCHLDADMVYHALERLDPAAGTILLIENVGNLVCPALFDLGEHSKVLVCSVTEGDDKPLKYPYIVRASALVLLNKMDLAPHVRFDPDRFTANVAAVNARCAVLRLSAETGAGVQAWYDWLATRGGAARG